MTEERDRTPPQEIRAEFAVLGSMMLSAEARNQVVNLLDPRDFYRDHHGALFSVMAEMDAAGEPVDGITVLAALRARGMLRAPTDANLLHSLVESVPTTANVAYYADQVRDAAVRRRIIEVGTRIVQAGYTADQGSGQDAAEWAHDQTAHLRDSRYYDDPGDAETLDGLLSVDAQYDWLIPGLVEKADRVMLTGGEGSGKSTLVRQIAVCVAAGLHPFTFTDTPPRCVMVVDLENGRSLSQRRYRGLSQLAARHGKPIPPQGFFIHLRPSGIDLTRPDEARWLLRRVEALMPDLLVIGPVYKMHAGDPNDEPSARTVAQVLDQARDVCGSALLIEAHSPHGNGQGKRPVRPFGSSLWLRWPEFGYGLRLRDDESDADRLRLMDFKAWRGPRDEREWPSRLRAGQSSSGGPVWPWVDDSDTPVEWRAAR